MRYLAIGDIHVCFQALSTLIALVPVQPEDMVIGLGDYLNRGPQARAVLEWLITREKQGKLIALRGNHEIMTLQARESQTAFTEWLGFGGRATLASYAPSGCPGQLTDIPNHHWDFLEHRTRGWYETEHHFFVHANANFDCPLAEQPDYMLYWAKLADPPPHVSGKITVCGHTPQKSGTPRNFGHAVCIDTWAYGKGWLTCLDVESGKYWQANEQGETRTRWLDEA